ncbi:sterol desaturase family protein [Methylocystis echinoides]|uniref:Sterol desaturase n=1 Tax=Methylocystis echinoides TaxID=29468 RepID=A0A9W6LRH4_9HYPH|nr:sterol desaturase family protein [Methylocystis echinoides]GLI92406.1 sterol desaturase [Methylocystis echinoides]
MTLSGIEGYLFGGAVLLFAILLVVEKKHPFVPVAKEELKKSFATNTGAFLINNLIMSALSLSSLLIVASNYAHYGLLGDMPDSLLKWVLSFILFDFAVYVWHYLGHKYEFLWRFHKIHHSDKCYHVTTGLRFHVLDQFLEVLVKCFCVVLFGVPASIVVVCELVRMFFVLFHHGNFTFPGERLVSWLIITPHLHRAHHSTLRAEHDSNFGIVLSVWDIIFRTRKELVPAQIGLELIEAENLVQLFSLAFLTERRLARLLHLVPRRRA